MCAREIRVCPYVTSRNVWFFNSRPGLSRLWTVVTKSSTHPSLRLYIRTTSKAQITHNIFAHNIEIKRYWNKKIKKTIFYLIFFSCVNWKYLFLDNCAYWKYFLKVSTIFWRKKYLFSKMSFNLFISMLCAKI